MSSFGLIGKIQISSDGDYGWFHDFMEKSSII